MGDINFLSSHSARISSSGDRPRHAFLLLLLPMGILILAFLLRLSYVWEIRHEPDFDAPSMDALYHHQWALGLATGQWDEKIAPLQSQPYFRAPFYVFFLASLYRALGPDFLTVRVVQALMGSLSCLLIYWLGRRLFGRFEGAAAGFMAATYWVFIYFDGELLLPVMEVFLDVLAILLLLEADRRKKWGWWLAAGLVLGVSAITRPNILIFIPLVMAWAVFSPARRNLRESARIIISMLIGIALIILPVTVRNAVVGNDLVLIASQGGVNFFIGNNPRADGVTAVVPGTRGTWWGGYYDSIRMAEEALGRKLKPSEVSDYWLGRGLAFIRENLGDYIRLIMKKVVLLAGNFEIPNNKDLNFQHRGSRILRWLPLDFAIILALGLVGMVLSIGLPGRTTCKHSRRSSLVIVLFVLSYGASIVLFFVTARYRVPLIPFLMIFAAHALRRLWELLVIRQYKLAAICVSVILVLAVLTHMDPYNMSSRGLAQAYYGRGVDFALRKDHLSAVEQFQLALRENPGYADAQYNLGLSLLSIGKVAEAEKAFRKTITLTPRTADAHLQLGMCLLHQGRSDEALDALERAVVLEPGNAMAHNLLGVIMGQKGQLERGIKELKQAIALDPSSALAHYNLACLYALQGNRDEGIKWLEKALAKGYGPLDKVLHDPDLRSLHADERFRRLVEDNSAGSNPGQPSP